MNSRIMLYTILALVWLGLAVAIPLGWLNQFVGGEAESWRRYLAIGICTLMALFNVMRIVRLRKAQARIQQHTQPDDQRF